MLKGKLNALKLGEVEKDMVTDHDSSESSMKASCCIRPAIVNALAQGSATGDVKGEVLEKSSGMKISLKE